MLESLYAMRAMPGALVREAWGIRIGDEVSRFNYPFGRVTEIRYYPAGTWVTYRISLNDYDGRWHPDEPAIIVVYTSGRGARHEHCTGPIIQRDGCLFVAIEVDDGGRLYPAPGDEVRVRRDDSVVVVEQLEMFA